MSDHSVNRGDARLARALDPDTLRGDLQTYLDREYPDRGLTLSECSVLKFAFRHDDACELRYRIAGMDGAGKRFVQLLSAELPAPGTTAAATPDMNGADAHGWKPSSHCAELGLVLTALPHGCKIDGLAVALVPEWVRERALAHREALGIAPDERIADVDIEPIKVRPSKHCLLRYRFELEGGAAGPRTIGVYAKVYRKRSARVAFEAMQLAWDSPARREGVIDIPRPVLWDEPTRSLWTTDWGGARLAGDHGSEWSRMVKPGAAEHIAGFLAALQVLDNHGLESHGPNREEMLESLRDNAEQIVRLHPELAPTMARVVALFESADRDADARPPAFVHGSFKLSQLLVQDERLGVVDFDWAAAGDPHHDVGEFAASLYYLCLTHQAPASSVEGILDRFAATYRKRVPWTFNARAAAWAAGIFLVGKIQHSLKTLETHSDASLEAQLELVVHVLTRVTT